MSVTAGALSKVLIGQNTASLSSAVATGGTGPYTYQWYKSTTTGFSPGAGNIISGATALTLVDSGLTGGQTYYYVVVATDTGAGSATSNSTQLTVVMEPAPSQNQFAQSPIVGLVDMKVGPTNLVSAQLPSTFIGPAYPGQFVKISATTGGALLQVVPITSKADAAIGMIVYNFKDRQYANGEISSGIVFEIALFGTVVWAYATGAVTQFAQVCLDSTYVGGVQATGNTATWVGWAFDGAAAAGPIRVMLLQNAAFATA